MQSNELRYEYLSNGVEITGYVGYPEVLTIPAEIDGKKVVGIGERAFSRCLTLKKITAEEGLEYIAPYAFYECSSLSSIDIPDSIRKIGRKAFEKTKYYVETPRVNGKLYVCAHLIDYHGDLPRLAINGCVGVADEAFAGKNIREAVFFDGLKYVGDRAFQRTALEEVVLPFGVESVGDKAFSNCEKLEKAELPSGIRKIGYDPFSNTPLEKDKSTLYIGNYLIKAKSGGKFKLKKGVERIADGAFANGKIQVALLEGVKEIPDGCFFNCRDLIKVSSSTVERAGKDAFANCESLAEVKFADPVFGENCFYGCPNISISTLSTVDKNEVYLAKRLLSTNEIYGEYKVREGTLEIYPAAFADNTKLVKVYLPDSVEKVGRAAFSGCKNLSSLKLPKYLEKIENDLCRGDEKLKYLEAPEEVKHIGNNAFENTRIAEFDFKKVEQVGGCAFLNSSISRAVNAEGIKIIGERAFERSGLGEITVNECTISKNAFAFSRSLRKVDLGVIEIPENAFYACTSLKSVTFAKNARIGKNAFAYCGSLSQIDLDEVVLSESSFEKCVKLSSAVVSRSLPAKAFKGCSSLKTVVLQEGVEIIESEAFSGCEKLEELSLPSTLTTIAEKGFEGCAIKELILPAGVSIGASAFAYCEYLGEIKTFCAAEAGRLGDKVFEGCSSLIKADLPAFSSIGKRAFANCENLGEISLKEGLTSIGEEAFSGDDKLKFLRLPRSAERFGRDFIADATIEKDNFLDTLKEEKGSLLKFGGCLVKYKGDNEINVPRFSPECYDDDNWALGSISAYDRFFAAYLEDKPLKEPYVKSRLLYPVGLTEKNKAAFLREYFPAIAEKSVEERNVKEIATYAKNGCFNAENLTAIIEIASKIKAVEITSLLLSELKKIK